MNFTFCIDLKYLVWLLNVRSQGSGLPSVIGNLINPKIQPAKDCVYNKSSTVSQLYPSVVFICVLMAL